MAKTLAEKLLSQHIPGKIGAGDYVLAPVHGAMASDTTAPAMIKAFQEMGGQRVWQPDRLSLVLDHAAPAPNERIAALHQMVRQFAHDQGVRLYDVGEGICHHIMLEEGHVQPGDIFVGADSHTCTYGAIGAFAIGVGSTDLAAVLKTGQIWLRVPESIAVRLKGKAPQGLSAKDIMLHVCGLLGPDKCSYRALEFSGQYFNGQSLSAKIPFANMGAELGAKMSVVVDEELGQLLPDADAKYVEVIEVDLSSLGPQLAMPHAPHRVGAVSSVAGKRVHQAFLGSCTNTRLEDLQAAARVLQGRRLATHVRMFVAPATKKVMMAAMADGTLQTLMEAGCVLLPSGCGPCVGTHLGVPGDGEVVISAANRNFQGRMGNPRAEVYLASPETVAASALAGEICSTWELGEGGCL